MSRASVSQDKSAVNGAAARVEQVTVLLEELHTLRNRLSDALVGNSDPISLSARKVLQELEKHGPHSVPSIARLRGSTRQNIQILVNRLEAAGHVELIENPGHKRSALVGLTDKGAEMLQCCEAAEEEFLERVASEISSTDVDAILRSLLQMKDVLNRTLKHLPAKRRSREQQPGARARRSKRQASRKQEDSELFTGNSEMEKEEGFPINLL